MSLPDGLLIAPIERTYLGVFPDWGQWIGHATIQRGRRCVEHAHEGSSKEDSWSNEEPRACRTREPAALAYLHGHLHFL